MSFQCLYCISSLSSKGSLRAHISTYHPDKKKTRSSTFDALRCQDVRDRKKVMLQADLETPEALLSLQALVSQPDGVTSKKEHRKALQEACRDRRLLATGKTEDIKARLVDLLEKQPSDASPS